MRFGIFVPQGWRMDLVGIDPAQHWGVMAGLARRADANPVWESIWVFDHFHTIPMPSEQATHEAWSLMSAFAAVTGRVRLGQMCTCVAYRPPAYLAKVAATVDVISEGRLEMGIGAGWYEQEWRAYGYGFPGAGERLAALDEAVQILRDMWTTGSATFDGTHFQVDEARCYPRPLQGTSSPGSARNGIPMWIAGGGERKTLRIAAEYADYTNFDGSPEGFARKSEILKGHCERVGRNFEEIVRSSDYNVFIGNTEEEVEDRFEELRERLLSVGADPARVERSLAGYRADATVGTPEQIIAKLRTVERLGLSYAIVNFPEAAYDVSGIELFEREVIPAFQETRVEEPRHRWHLPGRD